jgi:hypothetical protein
MRGWKIACAGVLVGFTVTTNAFPLQPMARRQQKLLSLAATTLNNDPLLWVAKQKTRNVIILSNDPLVYVVQDLLSADECRAYHEYVRSNKNMTRSNPPNVSLQLQKLWPLCALAVLSGLPPYIRLMQNAAATTITSTPIQLLSDSLFRTILPNMAAAFTIELFLAYAVVLPLIRFRANVSSRTSVAVALNSLEDMQFVSALVDRVSEYTNTNWTNWEAPVVTRYDPGAVFARHGDASPTKGSEWTDSGGQRVVTCICYLNSLEKGQGGETYFDKLQLRVAPVQGQALIFFPANSTTALADDRTTHESLPPTNEKWIVQMFGRMRRVPPPLGLPNEYSRKYNGART